MSVVCVIGILIPVTYIPWKSNFHHNEISSYNTLIARHKINIQLKTCPEGCLKFILQKVNQILLQLRNCLVFNFGKKQYLGQLNCRIIKLKLEMQRQRLWISVKENFQLPKLGNNMKLYITKATIKQLKETFRSLDIHIHFYITTSCNPNISTMNQF